MGYCCGVDGKVGVRASQVNEVRDAVNLLMFRGGEVVLGEGGMCQRVICLGVVEVTVCDFVSFSLFSNFFFFFILRRQIYLLLSQNYRYII